MSSWHIVENRAQVKNTSKVNYGNWTPVTRRMISDATFDNIFWRISVDAFREKSKILKNVIYWITGSKKHFSPQIFIIYFIMAIIQCPIAIIKSMFFGIPLWNALGEERSGTKRTFRDCSLRSVCSIIAIWHLFRVILLFFQGVQLR